MSASDLWKKLHQVELLPLVTRFWSSRQIITAYKFIFSATGGNAKLHGEVSWTPEFITIIEDVDVMKEGLLRYLELHSDAFPVVAILNWLWRLHNNKEAVTLVRAVILMLLVQDNFDDLASNFARVAAVYIHVFESLTKIGHIFGHMDATLIFAQY